MNLPYNPALLPLPREVIAQLAPFGPGWLMVDEVVEIHAGKITTRKLLADDDPFITSHFARGPHILPGVLLIELVSQSAYLLGVLSAPAGGDPQPRLLARCSASFVSPARAGEVLIAEVELVDSHNNIAMYEAVVRCGERLVCRAKVFGAPDHSAEPVS